MVDTKGPEVRTGTLPGGAAEFEILDGSEVVLTFEDVSGEALPARGEPLRLHVDYANLPTTVSVGGTVLLDDGLITLRVVAIHNGPPPHTHRPQNVFFSLLLVVLGRERGVFS